MVRTKRKTLPHSTGTDNRIDGADKPFGVQLCLHGRLNAAQFEAGRKIQAYFELAEIGDLQA